MMDDKEKMSVRMLCIAAASVTVINRNITAEGITERAEEFESWILKGLFTEGTERGA